MHSSRNVGVAGRGGQRARGVVVGAVRFPGELAQFLRRQLRDVADAVSALRDVAEQAQSLDLLVRVKAAVRSGALRLHGAVALLPNPNDVRAQPGAPGDHFDCLMGISHKY